MAIKAGRPVDIACIVILAAAMTACTSSTAGTPHDAAGSTVTTTNSGSPATTSPKALDDIDMCGILSPTDLGLQGKAVHEPDRGGAGCTVSVQLQNAFDVLAVSTKRISNTKFAQFKPPPGSPNGRMTEISGRQAWLGSATSSTDKYCSAAFGAADGIITLAVNDQTQRGVDPCQTATQIAEKMIARTPAPE